MKRVRGRAETVALAVDFDDATLSSIVDAVNPDWLQLHGKEAWSASQICAAASASA